MKRMMICIAVASMLVFPIWSFACSTGDPTCSSVVDVKGYGDQFADYTVGNVNVQVTTYSHDWGKSEDWTGFNNSIGTQSSPCPSGNCGMNLSQGNYSVNNFDSNSTTVVNQNALMGSADMHTLGGLSACYTKSYYGPSMDVSGSLNQTHAVNTSFSGNLPGFGTANGSYSGTQSLNLNVSN